MELVFDHPRAIVCPAGSAVLQTVLVLTYNCNLTVVAGPVFRNTGSSEDPKDRSSEENEDDRRVHGFPRLKVYVYIENIQHGLRTFRMLIRVPPRLDFRLKI